MLRLLVILFLLLMSAHVGITTYVAMSVLEENRREQREEATQ